MDCTSPPRLQIDEMCALAEKLFASANMRPPAGVGPHRRKTFLDTMDACKQMLAGSLSREGAGLHTPPAMGGPRFPTCGGGAGGGGVGEPRFPGGGTG